MNAAQKAAKLTAVADLVAEASNLVKVGRMAVWAISDPEQTSALIELLDAIADRLWRLATEVCDLEEQSPA